MKVKEIQNTINTLQESINAMSNMLRQTIYDTIKKVEIESGDNTSSMNIRNAFRDSWDPSSTDPMRWTCRMKQALELKNGRDMFSRVEVTDEITKLKTYPMGGTSCEYAVRRDFLRAILTELGEL